MMTIRLRIRNTRIFISQGNGSDIIIVSCLSSLAFFTINEMRLHLDISLRLKREKKKNKETSKRQGTDSAV